MKWPYYFFLDNTLEFFKNGPVSPDVFNKNQLVEYYRNDHPEPNDINGALGEFLFKEQIFRGICEKVPVVKNFCYTDLRLNLFRTTLEFEVKTWVPYWSKTTEYNRNELVKKFLRFRNLQQSTKSNEWFYVQLITLVQFTQQPKYVIHTNRLEDTLFDILFVYDVKSKKCAYFNENIEERMNAKLNLSRFPTQWLANYESLCSGVFLNGR